MKLSRLFLLLCLSMLILCRVKAQTGTLTGKVLNSKDSTALSGAIVQLGDGTSTVTQNDGSFSLPLTKNVIGEVMHVALVGYVNKDVHITGLNQLVYLSPVATDLNEVIVIGYGTSRKKDLTGAVSTISAKDFNNGVVTTPEQLISGKAPGVQITANSGQPGGGSTIRIRGGASLSASNDPLIVIDGVPLSNGSIGNVANPLATINPNDIETFTVLKDANATAIYGSRASNGVIIITTKKGRTGSPVITFTTSNSLAKAVKYVDVLSADQIRTYVNEHGSADQIAMLGTANTDWQKEIYRTAFATDNNLSISGGFKWLPYRISAGYLNQNGILKRDNFKRGTLSINLSPRFFDNHLKVDLNLKGTSTSSFFANQSAIGSAIQFDPTQPVYDATSPYGGYFEWRSDEAPNPNTPRNPVAQLNMQDNHGTAVRSIGNLQLDYSFHFLPELHANANLSYDVAQSKGHVYVPADAAMSASTNGSYTHSKNKYSNNVMEYYLSYSNDIPSLKSNINAVAGYGYYTFKTTTYNYNQYAADSTTLIYSPTYPIDIQENRLLSYYGRLVYTFNNKYVLSATIRRDGSSKFAPANRWGTFPSLGLTWRLIDESFIKNISAISDLKIRTSYGVTGQQDGIGNYGYQPVYYGSQNVGEYQIGNTFYSYYSPSAYDQNLKWESTKTYNIGLDFGFLKNRLTGSVDYYFKKTKDLLSTIPIAVGSNFSNYITTNVGNMQNNGLEINVNGAIIRSTDFTWNAGFNISFYRTKITNLTKDGDPTYTVPTGGITGSTGNYIQEHVVGLTPYSFYVYKQVYGSDGKPLEGVYADLNGDGVITSDDMYHYHSPAPKTILGFNTSFGYKNWTLSTVLRGNIGNYIYDNVSSNFASAYNILNPGGSINNSTTDIFNTGFTNKQYWSDYYIKNASFLKMDNLMLSYAFGPLSKEKGTFDLTVSGNVQNVFTITKYKGIDPESTGGIDMTLYPRPRTYSLTLNLRF